MKPIFAFLFSCSLAAVTALAADLYVSKDKGSNKNAGTKDAPMKNIQKAIDKAQDGDVIHIAQGLYFGTMDIGYIEIKKSVTLLGGYSPDFSSRDTVKYPVLIQPTNASNATGAHKPALDIQTENLPNTTIVIDGLIFDKGESNNYHGKDGKPEGVETGMLLHPPMKGEQKYVTTDTPLIKGRANSDITIQNCFFLNSPNYGIMLGNRKGKILIKNNVFVGNAFAGVEIFGTSAKPHETKLELAYNTILFNWSRTKDLSSFGYGTRIMTNMDYNIHHNIIGLSILSGIANTRIDKTKEIEVNDNLFFLNREFDMSLPSQGGIFMKIKAADFEEIESLKSASGNKEITDLAGLKDAINKEYLNGFLNVSYTEKTLLDPNSAANMLRETMGLNKQGTINSKVTMYANKYPLQDAFKLVGAVSGYGAQSMSDSGSTQPVAAPSANESSQTTPPAEQPKQEPAPSMESNQTMNSQVSEAKISEPASQPTASEQGASVMPSEANKTIDMPAQPEPASNEANATR